MGHYGPIAGNCKWGELVLTANKQDAESLSNKPATAALVRITCFGLINGWI
jgi:hypothetical protein